MDEKGNAGGAAHYDAVGQDKRIYHKCQHCIAGKNASGGFAAFFQVCQIHFFDGYRLFSGGVIWSMQSCFKNYCSKYGEQ